jgi:20S proteasome subunit alpha 6
MFRNQYDSDVTVWSPQGRIHQIEYAMEAVKQGSATVALRSKTHVVTVALKRAANEVSSHQKKIIPVDDHIGISVSGLLSDARLLARFMQSECLNYRWSEKEPIPVEKLVAAVADKLQINTQRYGRRPFGVGLLVAGYDDNGAHIFQTCPSANYYACKAMAIGSRSQSARTYLERHLDEFDSCSVEELVTHALLALRDTLPNEITLSTKNCAVSVVGKGTCFKIYRDEEVEAWLSKIADIPQGPQVIVDEPREPPMEDAPPQ